MTSKKQLDDMTRFNFNLTERQKKELVKKAKQANKNITNYILYQTLELDPEKEQTIEMLEQEYKIKTLEFKLEQQQQMIDQLKADKDTLKKEIEEVNALYRQSNQALMWHSLPWYRKMITKQVEDK